MLKWFELFYNRDFIGQSIPWTLHQLIFDVLELTPTNCTKGRVTAPKSYQARHNFIGFYMAKTTTDKWMIVTNFMENPGSHPYLLGQRNRDYILLFFFFAKFCFWSSWFPGFSIKYMGYSFNVHLARFQSKWSWEEHIDAGHALAIWPSWDIVMTVTYSQESHPPF